MVYMTDGLRMIVTRSCYRHGVFLECQTTVEHDTESVHVIGHRHVGCVVSVYGETDQHIICVLVVLYSVAGNDISHWTAVDANSSGPRTDP